MTNGATALLRWLFDTPTFTRAECDFTFSVIVLAYLSYSLHRFKSRLEKVFLSFCLFVESGRHLEVSATFTLYHL